MLTSFDQLNLIPELMSAVESMGYVTPTPVQGEAIPYILDGRDLLGEAPTGTGKTAAFGLPMLNKINPMSSDVQAMIICPTRELAMQIERELKKYAVNMPHVKIMTVCGGQNYNRQLAAIRKKPSVIVGTPGRLMDHLEKNHLKIKGLKMLVLDEADEMLNMGFREDIDSILSWVDGHHQTLLFSATMTKEIQSISSNYQKNPVHIKTKHNDNVIPQIDQQYIRLKEGKKLDAFIKIWQDNNYHLAVIFCNTKRRVDELCKQLEDRDYLAAALHGDMRQRERDNVMRRFRGGDLNILIATDVAARGIDVNDIEAVFNYDIPIDNEYYIHRIGRTARAGKKGVAYAFVTDKDYHKLAIYERVTKMAMTEISVAGLSNEKPVRLKEKKEDKSTVRLFINFGFRDKFDENGLKSALITKAAVPADAIDELKLLETYSFLEVEKEYVTQILDINGLNLGQRKLAIEVAGNKTNDRASSPQKSGYSDRPQRSYGDGERPKTYGERRFGGDSDRRSSSDSDRPKRNYGDSDRPKRSYGDSDKPRTYGADSDRPKRNYGDSDRPKRTYGDSDKPRTYGADSDRPTRNYGDSDRPKRTYGDSDKPRTYGADSDRPKRNYGDSDRPKRTYGDSDKPRTYGADSDRSKRTYGDSDKPRTYGGDSDRPKRNYGDSDRPKRTYGDSDKPRTYGADSDRPKRNYGDSDRPKRTYGDSDKPRTYGADSDRPKRNYGDSDRPKRTYGDSDKPRTYGADSDRPKRTTEVNKFFGEKPKSFENNDRPKKTYSSEKSKPYGDSTPKRSSAKPSGGAPRGYKKFSK